MAITHFEALKTKHSALDHELHEEMKRPHPDDFTIQKLKRKKLSLKQQMQEMETALA